jgi:thiol-disulfide isomerase/thioredoxin
MLFLVCIIGFLTYKITTKLNHKKQVAERTKVIPTFSFNSIDDVVFTKDDLRNIPAIFVYFNSDCDYCKSEATKIHERLSDFKDKQLVFVSFEAKDNIIKFAKEFNLYNRKNVTFLEDKKGEFSTLFDVNSIPYIVAYDAKGVLKAKFKGTTKIDKILQAFKSY